MPNYNYKCPACQLEFEQIITAYDTDYKALCPKCQMPSDFFMPLGSRSGVKFLFNYLEPGA